MTPNNYQKKEQPKKSRNILNDITPQLIVGIIIFIIILLLFLDSLEHGDILSTQSILFAVLLIGAGYSILHFNPLAKRNSV